eukprot:s118_g38.t1
MDNARILPESSSEYQRLRDHLARTGAVLSRYRLNSNERTVRKVLRLQRAAKLRLPLLERAFAVEALRCPTVAPVDPGLALRPEGDEPMGSLLLYHGCRFSHVEGILKHGFDPGFAGENAGCFFGTGIYFTDVAAKADTYVDAAVDGTRCLLLAEVCLGRLKTALRPMPRRTDGSGYDAVLGEDLQHGGAMDHREYVVFRGEQVLPRYLLWYCHHDTCPCFRCSKVLPPLPPPSRPPKSSEPPPSSEARNEEELLREERAVATDLNVRKPGCRCRDSVVRCDRQRCFQWFSYASSAIWKPIFAVLSPEWWLQKKRLMRDESRLPHGRCTLPMRRRHKGLEADAENQRTELQKEVSPLQQVLQFGFSGSDDLWRSTQNGQSPPPLASSVSAFLGAHGCVRLARCAVGWQRFVPTGLRGEDLQRWALEHWPARPVVAKSTAETVALDQAFTKPWDFSAIPWKHGEIGSNRDLPQN